MRHRILRVTHGGAEMRHRLIANPASLASIARSLIRLIQASSACIWCAPQPNLLFCRYFCNLQRTRVYVALTKAGVRPPAVWRRNAIATARRKNASGDRFGPRDAYGGDLRRFRLIRIERPGTHPTDGIGKPLPATGRKGPVNLNALARAVCDAGNPCARRKGARPQGARAGSGVQEMSEPRGRDGGGRARIRIRAGAGVRRAHGVDKPSRRALAPAASADAVRSHHRAGCSGPPDRPAKPRTRTRRAMSASLGEGVGDGVKRSSWGARRGWRSKSGRWG